MTAAIRRTSRETKRMNLVCWNTPEQSEKQAQREYVLPWDGDIPVQVGETFSVYTDHTPPNPPTKLLIRGIVISVEREFLEVVAIKDDVEAALYTTKIHLAALEDSGLNHPQLLR